MTQQNALITKIKLRADQHELSGIYEIPKNMTALLVLSHGAGAGMTHPFMEDLAAALAHEGIGTLRFNLPYMEAGKKMPGSPKQSIAGIKAATEHAIASYPSSSIYLAGKSYGGRMSSVLVSEHELPEVKGLIYFGFPLHAPGKPDIKRAAHLSEIDKPMLFLQGENDKLANLKLLKEVMEPLKAVELVVFDHADHSFKRPKKVSKESLIPTLAKQTIQWVNQ